MPLYEHVLIARQDLTNAQAEGLIEHFSAVITDNGGSVAGQEYWGLKTIEMTPEAAVARIAQIYAGL